MTASGAVVQTAKGPPFPGGLAVRSVRDVVVLIVIGLLLAAGRAEELQLVILADRDLVSVAGLAVDFPARVPQRAFNVDLVALAAVFLDQTNQTLIVDRDIVELGVLLALAAGP